MDDKYYNMCIISYVKRDWCFQRFQFRNFSRFALPFLPPRCLSRSDTAMQLLTLKNVRGWDEALEWMDGPCFWHVHSIPRTKSNLIGLLYKICIILTLHQVEQHVIQEFGVRDFWNVFYSNFASYVWSIYFDYVIFILRV